MVYHIKPKMLLKIERTEIIIYRSLQGIVSIGWSVNYRKGFVYQKEKCHQIPFLFAY